MEDPDVRRVAGRDDARHPGAQLTTPWQEPRPDPGARGEVLRELHLDIVRARCLGLRWTYAERVRRRATWPGQRTETGLMLIVPLVVIVGAVIGVLTHDRPRAQRVLVVATPVLSVLAMLVQFLPFGVESCSSTD